MDFNHNDLHHPHHHHHHLQKSHSSLRKSFRFKSSFWKKSLLVILGILIIIQLYRNRKYLYDTVNSAESYLKGSTNNDHDRDKSIATIETGGAAHNDRLISNQVQEPKILRSIVVRTKVGRLRGFVQNVTGVEVQTFLSIPYAQPPIGRLRFRRTKPVRRWSNTRDATRIPPPCFQPEYTQRLFPVHILNENITEDCLYLNVWSPLNGRKNNTVMIWIHGGLFTIGSTGIDEYDGRMLAAFGNVIVVSIQYRLGVFGFLDLDTERIPGNMGLFDQFTAIKWVRQNIKFFGGDPKSITLFGTSAGSISIGFHMFSPLTKHLFKRAILQSGSPMILKDALERGEKLAEKFASLIGCFKPSSSIDSYENNSTMTSTTPTLSSIYDDPEPIVDCIDRTPIKLIYEAQNELVRDNPVPFMPTIRIINLFKLQTKKKGFNQNEGALMLHLSYPQFYLRDKVPQLTKLEDVRKKMIEMGKDSGLSEMAASTIANLFIKGKKTDSPKRWAQKVSDVFSDVMFVCPTYQFIDKLQSFHDGPNQIYLYLFGQRAKNSYWGDWMDVTHQDEMNFVMGYPLRYSHQYSDDDIKISKILMKTWAYFASTG
ncbi:acetylcholinesterase-like protein 7 [Sarcoptes scabiei]|uniref:Carboxylic ester hydrolase n=1 Tax=Sarcoptes scabiei TaxID=52283 RepID=A0A132AJM7_SARSC|nr:acetylcholinesterase-like protein 7 [Sarcoptes scabiei]